MPSVEDAEIFLFDHLWDGEFAWSADVKAAAAEHGIPPKQLWQAQEPRGSVSLEIIDIGFPRRTAWRLDPDSLAELKRAITKVDDGEESVEDSQRRTTRNNSGITGARALEQPHLPVSA